MTRSQLASLVAAGSLVLGTGIAVAQGGPPRPVLLSAAEDAGTDDTTTTTEPEETTTTTTEPEETTTTTEPDTTVVTDPEGLVGPELVEEDPEHGERSVNHGFCVSEAARTTELTGRDRAEHIASVARSEAGKDGVSCDVEDAPAPVGEVDDGAAAVEAAPEAAVEPASVEQRRPAHAGTPSGKGKTAGPGTNGPAGKGKGKG